jgi:hypothetical protein
MSDPIQTTDPWRETVRDIFDILMFSSKPLTEVERRILNWIELRHHDYFCEGKTMKEWNEIRKGESDE